VSISVSVKGYPLSPRNVSLDLMNLTFLQGVVDGDVENLNILLEPGKPGNPNDADRQRASDAFEQNRKRRIEGVPPPPPAPAAAAQK